jgi:hypothetical protein
LPKAGNGYVVAEVSDANTFTWAASTEAAGLPDDGWSIDGHPLVRARNHLRNATAEVEVAPETLHDDGLIAKVVPIGRQLNGPVSQFGQRFWDEITAAKKDIGQAIRSGGALTAITYQDRYLFNPLMVRLLHEIIKPLVAGRPKTAGSLVMTVRTQACRNSDYAGCGRYLHHDWGDINHRDAVLRRVLERSVTRVSLETDELKNLPHDRTLSLQWGNGESLLLYLDQGLGHWGTVRSVSFPFTEMPASQASSLIAVDFSVTSRSSFPMAVFVLDKV